MSILTIILIVLLVILLFKVGLSILRFLISVGIVLLCIYLGYQGVLWLFEHFQNFSGLERMGFNDEYLAGQQGDEFIIYKFGDDYIRVYNTEFEMNEDLNQLKQPINLKPIEAYQ